MDDFVKRWLFDPTVGKLMFVVVGIAVAYGIGRTLWRSVVLDVADTTVPYRARQFEPGVLGARQRDRAEHHSASPVSKVKGREC